MRVRYGEVRRHRFQPLQCRATVTLAGDLISVLRRPFHAFPPLDERRSLSDGLLALVLGVALPTLVQELAALAPYRRVAVAGASPDAAALTDLFNRWSYEHRFWLPLYGLIAGLVLWLLAAALVHWVARALHGRGSFAGYLKLVGYVALAGIVLVPFNLIDLALKAASSPGAEAQFGSLLLVLSLAVFTWQNLLLILAARGHYALSMERATTAVLGPVGALIVLMIGLVIVGTVLFLVLGRPVLAG
jgi:hypothetical protein